MKKRRHRKRTKQESGSLFYVGIREPAEVHRSILECARDSIHLLQQHEKIKAIREEKIQTVLKLDTEVKQLRALVNKLKLHFPVTRFQVSLPTHRTHALSLKCAICEHTFSSQAQLSKHLSTHRRKIRKPAEERSAPPKKRSLSDLEQLEKELSDIEGKLGGMG